MSVHINDEKYNISKDVQQMLLYFLYSKLQKTEQSLFPLLYLFSWSMQALQPGINFHPLTVEKPAETQISMRLASHLDRAPNF
jgi:hypothetical protein